MNQEIKKLATKIQNKFQTLIKLEFFLLFFLGIFLTISLLFLLLIKIERSEQSELVALNLTKEGLELIRALRDETLSQTKSLEKMPQGECNPLVDSMGKVSCCQKDSSATKEAAQFLALEDGKWQGCASADKKSNFERRCVINKKEGAELEVSCQVSWKDFFSKEKKQVELSAYLNDWAGD